MRRDGRRTIRIFGLQRSKGLQNPFRLSNYVYKEGSGWWEGGRKRNRDRDRERGGQGDRERGSRIQFTSGTNNIKLKLNKVIEYLSVQ